MAARSNGETFVEKDGQLILKVDPISRILPDDENNTICIDDIITSGNGDETSNEGNNDVAITITPTKETVLPSCAIKTRKRRRSKPFPTEWLANWEIKERLRKNGVRVDKRYHHKHKRLTFRSFKKVKAYENDEKLPEHQRKENLAKKKKEERQKQFVEEFLAEAYNNLIHGRWVF